MRVPGEYPSDGGVTSEHAGKWRNKAHKLLEKIFEEIWTQK